VRTWVIGVAAWGCLACVVPASQARAQFGLGAPAAGGNVAFGGAMPGGGVLGGGVGVASVPAAVGAFGVAYGGPVYYGGGYGVPAYGYGVPAYGYGYPGGGYPGYFGGTGLVVPPQATGDMGGLSQSLRRSVFPQSRARRRR
jgi:hypothetical protein